MSDEREGSLPGYDKERVIDGHRLTFDPGDAANGSLYLCHAPGAAPETVMGRVAALRAAGLWSDAEPKHVAEDQRQAYKDQLELVAARRYETAAGPLLIARFDHPRYPSDADRWAQWRQHFERD